MYETSSSWSKNAYMNVKLQSGKKDNNLLVYRSLSVCSLNILLFENLARVGSIFMRQEHLSDA